MNGQLPIEDMAEVKRQVPTTFLGAIVRCVPWVSEAALTWVILRFFGTLPMAGSRLVLSDT